MKMKRIEFFIILFFSCLTLFSIEKKYVNKKIEESITVKTSRIKVELNDSGRNMIIISRKDIENSPASSLPELLKYIAGVDIRRRGISDIQADIGLKGAGFQELLIMIDGIKFNNPQSGHHNLDLPLSLNDIERIEILKGAGSSSFGANAVGGIINIITKNIKNREFQFSSEYGDFNTRSFEGFFNIPFRNINNFFSFQKSISAGYRLGTEYSKIKFFGKTSLTQKHLEISLSSGYSNKKFGAYSFYTQSFPNQWENTEGYFINGNMKINYDRYKFNLKFYHIEHNDDFVLDRFNPFWYRNKHKTKVGGIDFQFTLFSNIGITVLGGNFENDSISSNSLGKHHRQTFSFFIEQRKDLTEKLFFDTSLYFYNYSRWGWILIPSIAINYRLNNSVDVFINGGKSFRTPTYTELYYFSPANKGNPALLPEKSKEYELGIKINKKNYKVRVSAFKRFSREIIDWVKSFSDDSWKAENISEVNALGIEINFLVFPNKKILKNIGFDLTYVDSNILKKNLLKTKYILDNLKEQILLHFENYFIYGINERWELRYNKRLSGYSYFTIDTSIIKKIGKNFVFFLKINNITNEKYMEIGGIPMPGRWFLSGIKINI